MKVTKLGFAVVGAGNIGKVHALALSTIPEAHISVICDQQGASKEVAASYGTDWCSEYREAVTRPDVDVVCVCTPSGNHAEVLIAAAEAGKHVVVEKPIDVTLERAQQILDAVERAGVKLACIFPSRFKVGTHYVREALAKGRLGRLTLANAIVKWYRPDSYYEGSWRGTLALDGGGALINQSIHTIDLLQWLAGPVATVSGQTATLVHQIEGEDTASAVLTFANGALGVIQGATSCWPGEPARLELHGDRGAIILEEGRIVRWTLADAEPGEEARMLALEESLGSGSSDPMGISYEPHRRQLVDMIEAIATDRAPMVDGREALKALEIIQAIYQSSQHGRRVDLPLVVKPAAAATGARI